MKEFLRALFSVKGIKAWPLLIAVRFQLLIAYAMIAAIGWTLIGTLFNGTWVYVIGVVAVIYGIGFDFRLMQRNEITKKAADWIEAPRTAHAAQDAFERLYSGTRCNVSQASPKWT